MSAIAGKGNLREAQIEATIIRADGSTENLGVISYYHKNPLKRLWFKLTGKASS